MVSILSLLEWITKEIARYLIQLESIKYSLRTIIFHLPIINASKFSFHSSVRSCPRQCTHYVLFKKERELEIIFLLLFTILLHPEHPNATKIDVFKLVQTTLHIQEDQPFIPMTDVHCLDNKWSKQHNWMHVLMISNLSCFFLTYNWTERGIEWRIWCNSLIHKGKNWCFQPGSYMEDTGQCSEKKVLQIVLYQKKKVLFKELLKNLV